MASAVDRQPQQKHLVTFLLCWGGETELLNDVEKAMFYACLFGGFLCLSLCSLEKIFKRLSSYHVLQILLSGISIKGSYHELAYIYIYIYIYIFFFYLASDHVNSLTSTLKSIKYHSIFNCGIF